MFDKLNAFLPCVYTSDAIKICELVEHTKPAPSRE